jgi:hypothetical protein
VAWAFLAYCSCSYSEIINNTTQNAASQGLNWKMIDVLPAITGLTVDGVIYQYSAVKNPSDAMKVSIQNKNAIDSGYIFRKQDDWTGLPGNSITKVVPVDNIAGKYWGEGSITIDGKGEVRNPSVVYKYRYDTCVDPLSSPSCPGYAEAMAKYLSMKAAEPIDPLSNEYIRNALDSKFKIDEENDKKADFKNTEKKSDKTTAEKKAVTNSLVTSVDVEKMNRFEMMNNIPGFDLYSINIPSGVYKDNLRYPDKNLPDNRRARGLGLAQDRLHKAMVDSQYDR